MAKFPATLTPAGAPTEIEVEIESGKTLTTNFEELGQENRKRKRLYPVRNVTLQFDEIPIEDGRLLWQFHMDRGGAFEAFNLFMDTSLSEAMQTDSYQGEYVGSGDSATRAFNLPCKTGSSVTVKVDGATQEEGVDYNFSGEAGTDGADKIGFYSPPVSGERITADFTGYLKIRSRFKDDSMSYKDFYNRIITVGLKLKGLLNQ